MTEGVDYVVAWSGSKQFGYLDASLNAPPVRQDAPGRTFFVSMTQERHQALEAPQSVRSRLRAVLSSEWHTVGELMRVAELPTDRRTLSNASAALSTMFCHGYAERELRPVGIGGRPQWVYRVVTKNDRACVAPLTAGADRQDLPQSGERVQSPLREQTSKVRALMPFLRQAFMDGLSLRTIRKECGLSINTVMKIRRALNPPEVICECGKPSTHNGWCRSRLERRRQAHATT